MIAPGLSPLEDADLRLQCLKLALSNGGCDTTDAQRFYDFVTGTAVRPDRTLAVIDGNIFERGTDGTWRPMPSWSGPA